MLVACRWPLRGSCQSALSLHPHPAGVAEHDPLSGLPATASNPPAHATPLWRAFAECIGSRRRAAKGAPSVPHAGQLPRGERGEGRVSFSGSLLETRFSCAMCCIAQPSYLQTSRHCVVHTSSVLRGGHFSTTHMLDEIILGVGSTHTAVGVEVTIPQELRYQHQYIIGATGQGKTALMLNQIHQEVRRPHAVIVFDAGDLVSSLLESFDEEMLQRVRVFSVDHPIPYNPLMRRRDEPGRLENELFSLLDQITVESSNTQPLTARMKRVLSVAIRGVLVQEGEPNLSTLTTYLLEHKGDIRTRLELRRDEFLTAFEGVIDRLHQVLRDNRVRRVLCAPHALSFDEVIDNGEILLISLAGLEPPLVRLLGSVLNHGLSATVLERPVTRRRDVSVYIDEFQDYVSSHYAVENFQKLFAQGRRYKISLAVAHQDFSTVDARLLHTIKANAACTVAFSCGPDEADKMSQLFGEDFSAYSIKFLKPHSAIVRISDMVVLMQTNQPPDAVRYLPEDDGWHGEDPPDPLEVFTNKHATHNPYRDGRKPKRAKSLVAAPAQLSGPETQPLVEPQPAAA